MEKQGSTNMRQERSESCRNQFRTMVVTLEGSLVWQGSRLPPHLQMLKRERGLGCLRAAGEIARVRWRLSQQLTYFSPPARAEFRLPLLLRSLSASSLTGSEPCYPFQQWGLCYWKMVTVTTCSAPAEGSPFHLRSETEAQATWHDSQDPPTSPASFHSLLGWYPGVLCTGNIFQALTHRVSLASALGLAVSHMHKTLQWSHPLTRFISAYPSGLGLNIKCWAQK